jgi:hypothetical protein
MGEREDILRRFVERVAEERSGWPVDEMTDLSEEATKVLAEATACPPDDAQQDDDGWQMVPERLSDDDLPFQERARDAQQRLDQIATSVAMYRDAQPGQRVSLTKEVLGTWLRLARGEAAS